MRVRRTGVICGVAVAMLLLAQCRQELNETAAADKPATEPKKGACPCFGVTVGAVTWGDGFPSLACFLLEHGDGDASAILHSKGNDGCIDVLSVVTSELADESPITRCEIDDMKAVGRGRCRGTVGEDDFYSRPLSPAEVAQCYQELKDFATNDGVTCTGF